MGNFEKIIIKKERDKIRRETLGKFFFDLAKLVFAAIVLGEILLLQENVFDKSCWVMIMTGLSVTYSLAWLGNKILKEKNMILNPLSALFLVVGVITGLFIAWLYTKPGKKWLDEL